MAPDRTLLIEKLNEDLAQEYAAIIRYRTFASLVRPPHRLTLRPLFAREIADELSHAGRLADIIAALGGTPTMIPAPISAATTPEAMLHGVAEAEHAALARYAERREQADAAGQPALVSVLAGFIADEARHHDGVRVLATEWTDVPVGTVTSK